MANKTTSTRGSSQPSEDDPARPPVANATLIADLTSSDLDRKIWAQHNLVNRGHAAVPALLKALKDDDPHLRSAAAQVLTVIADPATATALAAMLDDEAAPVRWVAAEGLLALEHAGLKAALYTLIVAETISPQLKDAVRHILLKLRDDGRLGEIAKRVLAAMHNFEVDELVLVEAHRALSTLTKLTSST